MIPDYSYTQLLVDLIIGATIGCALMAFLQVTHLNPLDVEYEDAFGDGALTVLPEMSSAWVRHVPGDSRPLLPNSTLVRLRFANGVTCGVPFKMGVVGWGIHDDPQLNVVAYQVVPA